MLTINFKRIECHCCCCMATALCSQPTAFVWFRISSWNCGCLYENATRIYFATSSLWRSNSWFTCKQLFWWNWLPKVSTTKGRCKICQKNARYMCGKCGVHLHCNKSALCFDMYHTNKWRSFFLQGFAKLDILWSIVDLEIRTKILYITILLHIHNFKRCFLACNAPKWE